MNILIDYKLSGPNTTQGPDKAACHAQVVTTTIHECGGLQANLTTNGMKKKYLTAKNAKDTKDVGAGF
jgi:hypothetical protein